MTVLDFFARWRVRLGYFVAVVALWLARPTPRSIVAGASIGFVGLAIRGYAAGFLRKQEVLTIAGPYACTRNPLYFGSCILALGAAVALHSWWAGALVLLYFAVVYSFVMRREELELRDQHGATFDAYARSVPLFFPRLPRKRRAAKDAAVFSWAQYRKNHEYKAAFGFALLLVGLAMIWRLRTP